MRYVLIAPIALFLVACGPSGMPSLDGSVDAQPPPREAGSDGGSLGDGAPASCGGYVDPNLGGCWYVSDVGTSCASTCADRGGFDYAHWRHLGAPILHHFFGNTPVLGNQGALESFIVRVGDNYIHGAVDGLSTVDPNVVADGGAFACPCLN
jgi:hypothetical protein